MIAGTTPSSKGLPGFGSLILGVYEGSDFKYAGRVGTGFSLKQRAELGARLDQLAIKSSPFDIPPKGPGLSRARAHGGGSRSA